MNIEFDPTLKRPFIILGLTILLICAYFVVKNGPRDKASVSNLPIPTGQRMPTVPQAGNIDTARRELSTLTSFVSFVKENSLVISKPDTTQQVKIETVSDQQAAVESWDWSPDNKKIISSTGNLIDIQSKKHTSVPIGHCHNWSPDGKLIAYEARGGIWIIDSTGRNPRKVIETGILCTGSNNISHWYPDSNKFIFEDFQNGIYAYDLLTSDEILLYDAHANNVVVRSAAISRNGNFIAFMQRKNDPPGPENLVLMNNNGTDARVVTNFAADQGVGQPVFTADSGRVILLGNTVGENGGLLVYDIGNNTLKNITHIPADLYSPATISPDGKYAAYHAFGTLYVVNLDTSATVKFDEGRFILWSK